MVWKKQNLDGSPNLPFSLSQLHEAFSEEETAKLLEQIKSKEEFVPATILVDRTEKRVKEKEETTEGIQQSTVETDGSEEVVGVKEVVDKNYRYHSRSMEMDDKLATSLFNRIKPFLPSTQIDENNDVWRLHSVNPLMRYLHYRPGQFFKPHFDEPTVLQKSQTQSVIQSFITVQLYLSNNNEGETIFYDDFPTCEEGNAKFERVRVKPVAGDIIVFQHDLLHEGGKLHTEEKYSLRTDVLYQKE